ncbi:endo alpha-1,4 polygalactosaminidase [Demequina muriae]|uniref:Endo alpha-1,4 polygalactosaminidase n=1 Tax=Demequina muriae TaxID=3051664 RepID=A0ABT8GE72_9MICO|nr:endo alpha-1,4 polygalactosaminidase [Demequina sp. EGI L300058]MDN4479727.1 endo alpha-1,4 polygalactosaminidase [Demequina sp. EGI L300058]
MGRITRRDEPCSQVAHVGLGRKARALAVVMVGALTVASCAGEADSVEVELPPTEGVVDYQLGGAYDTVDAGAGPVGIDVVVRDATAEPLEGAYSVCYVNGFQTQPGEAEQWLVTPELLLRDQASEPVVDPDWPDEFILDPSTPTQREGILDVLSPVIAGCAEAGFDAVEIDNLDTWTRFDGVSEDGAHSLARAYVEVAHEHGLAIAQKNAAEVTQVAKEQLGFDFAVAEECAVWDECAAYADVYGEHVLQVEYPDALAEAGMTFAEVCGLPGTAPLTVLRDRDLVAAGEPGYVYESC